MGAILVSIFAAVANPLLAAGATVSGPIEGQPTLALGNFDLTELGYVTEEFFMSGTATSYVGVNTPDDGAWTVKEDASAPFTTRLIVVRPKNAARFNGSVVVEWLNVTAGGDIAVDWKFAHRELMRDGFAYVGASVQKVGIDGGPISLPGATALKKANPDRYGALSHPGDAFAYDIYSQAGKMVRSSARLLGPLKLRRVLATGDSQSAAFLTTYVNAIDPLAVVYDGYLIHSRFGAAAPVEGRMGVRGTDSPVASRSPVRLRPNVRVPVLTLITETDLIGGGGAVTGFLGARQPDNHHLRVWEIPGAAHGDIYAAAVGDVDSGLLPAEALAKSFAPVDTALGGKMGAPMNAAPQHHYVLEAAIYQLNRWVKDRREPPRAEPMATLPGEGPGASQHLALDVHGNSLGGIRTPWMDVPTARLSGIGQTGEGLAFLFGTTEVFDSTKLAKLYPGGRTEYLAQFRKALDKAVSAGFLLKADVPEIMDVATLRYPD